jgi:hypothetical protein
MAAANALACRRRNMSAGFPALVLAAFPRERCPRREPNLRRRSVARPSKTPRAALEDDARPAPASVDLVDAVYVIENLKRIVRSKPFKDCLAGGEYHSDRNAPDATDSAYVPLRAP